MTDKDRITFPAAPMDKPSLPKHMEVEDKPTRPPRRGVPRGRGGFGGFGFTPGYPPPSNETKERDSRSVCVRQLDYSTTKEQLEQVFSSVGNVLLVTIPTKNGNPKGYAYIELDTVEARDRAISLMTGTAINGREILVQPKRTNVKNYNKVSLNPFQQQVFKLLAMGAGYRGRGRGGFRARRGGSG